MLKTVDAVGHGVLRAIIPGEVGRHPFATAMRLADERLPDGAGSADVDLEGLHAPPGHVVDKSRHFRGISDRPADEGVIRRVTVDQHAAHDDARSAGRIGRRSFLQQFLRHHLVAHIAQGRNSLSKEQREQLIGRELERPQDVHEVHVSVDQPGNHEPSARVNHARSGRDGIREARRDDGLYAVALDYDRRERLHAARRGVEGGPAFEHDDRWFLGDRTGNGPEHQQPQRATGQVSDSQRVHGRMIRRSCATTRPPAGRA